MRGNGPGKAASGDLYRWPRDSGTHKNLSQKRSWGVYGSSFRIDPAHARGEAGDPVRGSAKNWPNPKIVSEMETII